MTADTDPFGELTVTTAQVTQWVTLVKAGRAATHGYRKQKDRADNLRPIYGSGKASSEA